jgi:hypothetical protein
LGSRGGAAMAEPEARRYTAVSLFRRLVVLRSVVTLLNHWTLLCYLKTGIFCPVSGIFMENQRKCNSTNHLQPKRSLADQGQSRSIKVNQG